MLSETVYSSNIEKLSNNIYSITEPSSMQLYGYGRPTAPPGHVLSFNPLDRDQPFRGPMKAPSMPELVRSTVITDRYTGVKVSTHPADARHPISHIDMTQWVLKEDKSDFDRRRFGSSGEELSEFAGHFAATDKLLKDTDKLLKEFKSAWWAK